MLLTVSKKFRVIELLHFHKVILPFYVAEFLFQKLQYVWEGQVFFCMREKEWYICTKNDDKESMLLFLHKKQRFFYS